MSTPYPYQHPATSIRHVRLAASAATLAALRDGLPPRAAKQIGHYSATLIRAGMSSGMAVSRAELFARAIVESCQSIGRCGRDISSS